MKEVRIKDICSKGSSSLKQKDLLKEGRYPVYGASGIAGYLDTYQQENEYIAIVKDGSGIGRVSFNQGKTSLIGTMQYILPKQGYNIRYIGYCLQSLDLSNYKQGAAIPHIYFRDYGERKVKVTDIESDQQRIVEHLDAAFTKIDELKANAEKQLSGARSLFQKALSEAMTPKEGWEKKTLKEIGTTQTGTTPSKNDKENYGDYIPFIRPSEIDYDGCGNLLYDSEIKLSKKGLQKGRLFRKESVIMVCIGATIGKVGFATKDISCNQQINVLSPTKCYDSKFLYYAMRNEDFKNRVIKEGTSAQATLPIINKGKWEKLTLHVPKGISEQQSIVSHLDTLSDNIRKLEDNYNKTIAECDALKQAILKEVFE